MSEETTNDGTWSGLKKTIIGTLTTVVTGGGVWLSTMFFGGHSEETAEDAKEGTKTEQVAPAAAPVVVNVTQSQENKQKNENGGGTVIRERVIEKQAPAAAPAPAPKKEEDSW
jgi:flagellar basal body-associated protein FliL